jgi:hypothetical protein
MTWDSWIVGKGRCRLLASVPDPSLYPEQVISAPSIGWRHLLRIRRPMQSEGESALAERRTQPMTLFEVEEVLLPGARAEPAGRELREQVARAVDSLAVTVGDNTERAGATVRGRSPSPSISPFCPSWAARSSSASARSLRRVSSSSRETASCRCHAARLLTPLAAGVLTERGRTAGNACSCGRPSARSVRRSTPGLLERHHVEAGIAAGGREVAARDQGVAERVQLRRIGLARTLHGAVRTARSPRTPGTRCIAALATTPPIMTP